jgi:predicted O-methyltransferase YrrM
MYFKKLFLHYFFWIHKFFTRLGIHVLPVHYYSPVPDIIELEKTKDVWAVKSELPGIHVDLDEQVDNLTRICLPFQKEYIGNRIRKESMNLGFGTGFKFVEAQALHGVVRHYGPARVIEVGSGSSSYCILKALEKNREETGKDFSLTCIEPFPSHSLKSSSEINLMPRQAQTVPFEVFSELDKGDLLFIDSTHTVKPGGDVNYLILEVLPRLRQGVIVHFHDIFLPFDYDPAVLNTYFHWTETSLLRAFLVGNERAGIIFCLSHLHYDRQEDLKKVFPEYNPRVLENGLIRKRTLFKNLSEHFPNSLYFRILK